MSIFSTSILKFNLFGGIQNSMFFILFNTVHNLFFLVHEKIKEGWWASFSKQNKVGKKLTTNELKSYIPKKMKGRRLSLGKLKMSFKKKGQRKK
jgi:hypothetical protein